MKSIRSSDCGLVRLLSLHLSNAALLLGGLFFSGIPARAQAEENQPPSVSGGISLSGPGTRVTMMAFPEDRDGTIDRVEYYQGSRLLGSVYGAPYNLTLRLLNAAPIVVNFTMVAVDNLGARSAPALAAFSQTSGTIPTDLPVTTGLQLWLRADAGVTTDANGGVTAWQDQSPHGNHAGALSAEYHPTGTEAPLYISDIFNGQPRVRFDGDDDVLEIANSLSLQPDLADWTVFVVGQNLTTSQGDFAPIIGSHSGAGSLNPGWSVALGSSNRLTSHFADGSTGHDFGQAQSISSALDDQLQIWQVEENRVDHATRFFFDGSPDGMSATAMPTSAVKPVGPIHLGRELGGANDRRAGIDLAEVIVFNRVLDVAERESVTTYLAGKYEIAALVITNRPPTVRLSAPAAGAELPFRQSTTLTATATDSDGGIALVEFFADERSLGVAHTSPFRLVTTQLPAGAFILTARATDNQGAMTTSAPVAITVVVPLQLSIELEGDQVMLTWDGPATLATAGTLGETWAPIPEATSPYRVSVVPAQQLFQLRQPTGIGDPTTPDLGYDPTAAEEIPFAPFSGASTPPPAAMVNTNFLPPVGRQGTTNDAGSPGSCAAWSSTYGFATFTAAKRGNYSPTNSTQWASPAYIYIKALEQKGLASNSCSGSQFAFYFSTLAQGGTPSLQTAPYVASCSNLWSNYGGQNIAPDPVFAVTNIAAVATTNLIEIKRILASNRVLVYGTRLYTQWGLYQGEIVPYVGSGVFAKQPDGKLVGHCMLIIGYDDNLGAILIQNSEGSNWGGTIDGSPPNVERTNAGYVWMAYETFTTLAQGKAFFHVEP